MDPAPSRQNRQTNLEAICPIRMLPIIDFGGYLLEVLHMMPSTSANNSGLTITPTIHPMGLFVMIFPY